MYSLLERALKSESGIPGPGLTPHFNNIYKVTETALCSLLGTQPTSKGTSQFSMLIKIKQRCHTVDLIEKKSQRLNNLLQVTVPANATTRTQTWSLSPEDSQVHCYGMVWPSLECCFFTRKPATTALLHPLRHRGQVGHSLCQP